MHEMSLCKSIFAIIQQKMTESRFQRIKKINLELGQLGAVDKAALTLAFDVMKQGTQAENAELFFIGIPGKAICHDCNETVSIDRYYDACNACGKFSLTIIQGEELRIKSMEVE